MAQGRIRINLDVLAESYGLKPPAYPTIIWDKKNRPVLVLRPAGAGWASRRES